MKMRTIDIAHKVDEYFLEDEFHIDIVKCGGVSVLKITSTKVNGSIEFCRVGDIVGFKINDNEIEISLSDSDKILSPYIGKRLFISLFH